MCSRLSLLVLALFVLVTASLPAQISLTTVVDLAQRNSSAVKLASADVQKAQAALSETKDVFVPSMTFGSGLPAAPSIGFSGNPPSIFNASIQSMVISFSQWQYIKSARAGFEAAALSLKDAREQAALEASTNYLELDVVTSELEVARQQSDFADRLVSIEQQRAEVGVDPLSELLQSRLTAAELRLKRMHLESRAASLAKQLSVQIDLPVSSIVTEHASIPEIPQIRSDVPKLTPYSVASARLIAVSKQEAAKGDSRYTFWPQINFSATYSRDTTLLNNADDYYKKRLATDNLSSGFSIQVPLFDMGHRAKVRESAADALRATVEAEQAERQNEIQISNLTGSLRELDAMAEIASLKQQIAGEQLKSVQTELQTGNGAGSEPGAPPQQSPKAEQLARIDERQKMIDSLDSGFDLSKARLSLLRVLGHMDDWLHELKSEEKAKQSVVLPK
jgi:outer membrane protein TolC